MDVQDVMRLEVEKALERRHLEGGGGVFFSVQDWAEKLRFRKQPFAVNSVTF